MTPYGPGQGYSADFAGLPPQSVFPSGLTPDLASKLANVDVKQVLDYCLYDTKSFVAGTAIPSSNLIFFGVQLGAQDVVANSAAVTYTKTAVYTNIVQPAQLERGQVFICRSIQAIVCVPGNFDLTVQATGDTTRPSTLPTMSVSTVATAGVLVTNLVNAVIQLGVFSLKVGTNFFENGPLWQFPSEFGISGYAGPVFTGTAQAAVVTVANESVANNGFGRGRQIIPRAILAGQNFGGIVQFPIAFTPSRNFDLQIVLRGTLYRDIS